MVMLPNRGLKRQEDVNRSNEAKTHIFTVRNTNENLTKDLKVGTLFWNFQLLSMLVYWQSFLMVTNV